MDRYEREKTAYDVNNVAEHSLELHNKFSHVFECPNTIRNINIFQDIIRANITGKRVLDIGCGSGASTAGIFSHGAGYMHGIDISEKQIAEAKKREIKGLLEFSNKDIMAPIDGRYDIIYGLAALHHMEYRTLLGRLYDTNLNDGGLMLFMEPLGSNLLIRLYHVFSKSVHTPDEKPFSRKELRWLRENFPDITIIPVNYLSFFFGIISSFIFPKADNILLRMCDKIDCWIATHLKFMVPNFRYGIFVIRKPVPKR